MEVDNPVDPEPTADVGSDAPMDKTGAKLESSTNGGNILHPKSTNWHQSMVHFTVSIEEADQPFRDKLPLLIPFSVVIVLAQVFTASGIFSTCIYPACTPRVGGCGIGLWCEEQGTCSYCGSRVPLELQTDPITGKVLNAAAHPEFMGFNETLARIVCTPPITGHLGVDATASGRFYSATNVATWCESCHHQETGKVNELTGYIFWQDQHALMGFYDNVAYGICCLFLGLQVAKEWNDISLCTLAVRNAGNNIKAHWRCVFVTSNFIRRYLFLPSVLVCIPFLVLTQTPDAMDICFNTVS